MFASRARLPFVPYLSCLLMAVFVSAGRCERGLEIQVKSVQTKYCAERNGTVGFNLRLEIDYVNSSATTYLVPTFARISSYTLLQGDAHSRTIYAEPSQLEMPKLSSQPDPQLFTVLPPGGRIQRIMEASIPVGPATNVHAVQAGSEYSVEFEVDHWPRAHKDAEVLGRLWKDRGVLLTTSVRTNPPIRLHIDEHPVARLCWMQID